VAVSPARVPPRVLVVDDSIVVRKILSMTLQQVPEFTGAVVDEAGNGVLALRRMEEERYALVISDIRMPLMDGLELVRRVRQELRDGETPIVLVSTLGTEDDVKRGIDAGATAYVLKPLSPYHLKAAIRDLVRRGWPLRHAPATPPKKQA
jgi:CheY-like chemotaxis protein